jgi:hypothetical protein
LKHLATALVSCGQLNSCLVWLCADAARTRSVGRAAGREQDGSRGQSRDSDAEAELQVRHPIKQSTDPPPDKTID